MHALYMPYPPPHPRALSLPSVDYLPIPKSAHEQSNSNSKKQLYCLTCMYTEKFAVCICSMHGNLPYLAFCSHDLHISCFPEGIMTGWPPRRSAGWAVHISCRQGKRLFILPVEPVILSMECFKKKARFHLD